MHTLFISDLHLDAKRPHITESFIRFLDQLDSQCQALYILGDLFEAWLGDDCVLPAYEPILTALKTTTDKGLPIFIQHGNRDFLLGENFAQRTGCKLLPESLIIDLHGTPTLIMHGDTLCTDDLEYQKFRQMVRDPQWQQAALSKSPQERMDMARKFREMSKTEMASKADDIMDVNQSEVERVLQLNHTPQLIHGHTHRPALHPIHIGNDNYTRIVLGDWYEQSSVLRCDDNGCNFID